MSAGHTSRAGSQSLREEPLKHPLQTSFTQSVQAVQKLLQNPIKFVLATNVTFEDELKMAPTLRLRKTTLQLIDPNQEEKISQRQHRFAVSLPKLGVD